MLESLTMRIEDRVARVRPSSHFVGIVNKIDDLRVITGFDIDSARFAGEFFNVVEFDPENELSTVDFEKIDSVSGIVYFAVIEQDCYKRTGKEQISDKLIFYEKISSNEDGTTNRLRGCIEIGLY